MIKVLAIDPKEIVDIVCQYYGLEVTDVMGRKRNAPIMKARHVARFLIRFNTNLSLKEVAQVMIGRKSRRDDHTTIIHSVTQVENWMDTNDYFHLEVCDIQQRIANFKSDYLRRLEVEILEKKAQLLRRSQAEIMPMRKPVVTLSEHEKVLSKYA